MTTTDPSVPSSSLRDQDFPSCPAVLFDPEDVSRAQPLPDESLPSLSELVQDPIGERQHLELVIQLTSWIPGPKFGHYGLKAIQAVWNAADGDTTKWESIMKAAEGQASRIDKHRKIEAAQTALASAIATLYRKYPTLKAMPDSSNASLQNELNLSLGPVEQAVTTLSAPILRWYGLEAFVYGASLQFAMYQERALIDLDRPPWAAPHTDVFLPCDAARYADQADATMAAMLDRRAACVGYPTGVMEYYVPGGGRGHSERLAGFEFVDAFDGTGVKVKHGHKPKELESAQAEIDAQRSRYVTRVVAEYDAKLAPLRAIVAKWRELTIHPMGFGRPRQAPGLNGRGWQQNLPYGDRWPGPFDVRYRVRFVDSEGTETAPGPWWSPPGCDADGWHHEEYYAIPSFQDVPLGSGDTVERRIYRQLRGEDETLSARIPDNVTTEWTDGWGLEDAAS